MTFQTKTTVDLTRSGFTPSQASALKAMIDRTAASAIDELRRELAEWHAYLAMYLLIQIGIVLLAILMSQTIREELSGNVVVQGINHSCDLNRATKM